MSQPVSDGPNWTPRAQRLLDGAERWASDLGHSYLGTEHLLLSMLDDPDGLAAGTLRSSLDVDATRTAVLEGIAAASQERGTTVSYPVGFPRGQRLSQDQLDAEGLTEAPDYDPEQ